jgi:hypothetical protein
VIIWCTVLSALPDIHHRLRRTPEMLIALRLIGGLAIGGLLAPAWSINIEAMPAGCQGARGDDHHARLLDRRGDGRQVTNWLRPQYGWEGVFFFCGATTACSRRAVLHDARIGALDGRQGQARAEVIAVLSRFDPRSRTAATPRSRCPTSATSAARCRRGPSRRAVPRHARVDHPDHLVHLLLLVVRDLSQGELRRAVPRASSASSGRWPPT